MGNNLSLKLVGKTPLKNGLGYKLGKSFDRELGKALGTVPGPTPVIPPPPPPETIDEGAYVARDRSRRRAKLAQSAAPSTQAAYSPAPKALLGG